MTVQVHLTDDQREIEHLARKFTAERLVSRIIPAAGSNEAICTTWCWARR